MESLLTAAGGEIAEHGYAGATMCGIAGRAGAAIGSLYQFYPNKEALAEALRERYAAAGAPLWQKLQTEASGLAPAGMARRLVGLMLEMNRRCPGFAALLEGPRTQGSNRRRSQLRRRIAAVLRARQPKLAAAAALHQAAVIQPLLRGVLTLPRAHAAPGRRDVEQLLALYLGTRLGRPQ
ncbi:MAG: TetR/AcrR family transcriptional regulator [Terriglobales bacterium]